MMYKNAIVQEDIKDICEHYDFSGLKGKNVLVTGAMGMLAHYYIAFLLNLNDKYDYGIKVYALEMRREPLEAEFGDRKDVEFFIQDVCEKIAIPGGVDLIFHAASRADPEAFKNDPVGVIKANVEGTLNILELAKEKGARVVFPSTREVYGAFEDSDLIKEADCGVLNQTDVRSCYPESKRMAENLIVCFSYQNGVSYEIARLAHAYGPMMRIEGDGRVMPDLLGRVVRNEDIVLKSSGEAKRAFCYVADAVAGLLLISASKKDNEIYNLANETEEISIADLATNLSNWYGLNLKKEIAKDDGSYLKFKRTSLDTDKIQSELGWKPLFKLEDGIKRTVEFYKK